MALRILQPGIQPLGQFDGYDGEVSALLGGEVVTLVGVRLGNDTAAADVERAGVTDGYVPNGHPVRPVVTRNLTSGNRPLFLADEGTAKYGTLFGEVVGTTAGQVSTGGAVLGPHTTAGSGKVTLWDKPGLYAVTLDACDTTPSTGLLPGNTTLSVGAALYASSTGLLTPDSGNQFENLVVGRLAEFSTDGSLVTTPNSLVSALTQTALTQAIFHFRVE